MTTNKGKTMGYQDSNPIVQFWMDAERNATTPEEKKQANITMLAVMKALQFERGQRTKISYKAVK
jgi:hypothetical protein